MLSYGKILQAIALILNLIGFLIIANWIRKPKIEEDSHFGIPVNLPSVLGDLIRTPKKGAFFVFIGVVVQFASLFFQ